MPNYSNLGLTSRLQSQNSLLARQDRPIDNIDFDTQVDFPLGGINYSHITASGRTYTAVVSLSKQHGMFTDIQAALDYVNSLGGGRILIQPGTYVISEELTIYSDTILEGVTTNDCIIDFNNTTNNLSIDQSATDIKIARLTFQNCRDTTNGTIYINRGNRIHIEWCNFDNNKDGSNNGYDINMLLCNNVTIEFCTSTNSATFIYAQANGRTNRIANCTATCANYAIWGKETTTNKGMNDCNFIGCVITSDTACAFGALYDCSFINCFFDSEVTGGAANATVELYEGIRNKFIGNEFNVGDDSKEAVLLDDTNAASANQIFRNSFIGNSLGSGGGATTDSVRLVDADTNFFTANGIGATRYAVNISNIGCAQNVIVGNYLSGGTADTNDAGTATVIANNST